MNYEVPYKKKYINVLVCTKGTDAYFRLIDITVQKQNLHNITSIFPFENKTIMIFIVNLRNS